ncbi:polysaccharide biosynthesis tyrosine autokinase [Crocosphaera sp. UHCC 0190]|uniref:GumC family protein n=1 Tax=Crocosphaera sp. UHCC 0190 TaxID=3110246 RepID=UPI002B1EC1E5|nr:polysaccharide biosynthesis tyrosine autokinase [Crocosphaera sp. UHCC 0190]MEA5512231.1 polysaccharide biosynthesis tyrosine autokinase [Crocosphaera sp. UHCC 0190]
MSVSLPNLPEEQLEDVSPSGTKGFNFRPYLRICLRKVWLIAGLASLTTLAAWLYSTKDPYTYTGNFFLLVEPISASAKLTNPSTLTRTQGVPREDMFELDYPTNLVFLKSPGMTFKIAQEVYEKEKTRPVPAIWKDLRENLKVERAALEGRGGETKIFQVYYTGENPKEVQTILSTAAETFVKYSAEDRETNIKAGVKFIDGRLPDLQKRLRDLKTKQKQLRQTYELIDPTPKNNEVLNQISTLESQLLTTEIQLQAQKELVNSLQEQLNLSPEEAFAAATLSQDPSRMALLSQLQELDSQIAVASATFTDGSPQLQDLQDKRQNVLTLLNQKTQEIITLNSLSVSPGSPALSFHDPTRLQLIQQLLEASNQVKLLESQLQTIKPAKQQREQQVKRYPNLINEYSDLENQIQLTQDILNKLLLQRETLEVESAQELPWQLISKPQIPLDENGDPIGYPPDSKKKLFAGFMGGLLLGMGLAIGWEKRQNMFYTADDVSDLLSLPLLGEIPKDDRTALSPEFSSLSASLPDINAKSMATKDQAQKKYLHDEVLTIPNESLFLEAFDRLYTQLYLLQSSTIRSLMVCSVEPQDGQSTVALNLAISAANNGQRVLLVDTNFSNPQLHNLLNISNYKGLIQVIKDRVSPQAIIQDVPDIENLSILTAGESMGQTTKRLWSPQLDNLMEELAKTYDLVIYDTPPFLDSSDLKFMAKKAEGMLMVVALKKTSQSLAKKAVKEIQSLNLPLMGVVVNHLI